MYIMRHVSRQVRVYSSISFIASPDRSLSGILPRLSDVVALGQMPLGVRQGRRQTARVSGLVPVLAGVLIPAGDAAREPRRRGLAGLAGLATPWR
jgi:hypothetical protein